MFGLKYSVQIIEIILSKFGRTVDCRAGGIPLLTFGHTNNASEAELVSVHISFPVVIKSEPNTRSGCAIPQLFEAMMEILQSKNTSRTIILEGLRSRSARVV
jgi:hypothetical protein